MNRIFEPDYDPIEYHNYIYQRYSIDAQVHRYKQLIMEVFNEKDA
jgi:hypothetical protein